MSVNIEPKVSIVIPVYNTDTDYLRMCFRSVQAQTYKNIEVLVVDDGSSQLVADFLDSYVESVVDWRVFHRKNKGVSVARNFGIKNSSGEYVQFLDSDDFLEESAVAACVDLAQNTNADLVAFSLAYYDETLTRIDYAQDYSHLSTDKLPFCVNDLRADKRFLLEQLHPQPVTKLIRRDFLESNAIYFTEGIRIGEDHIFSNQLYLSAKRIAVLDTPLYRYRIFDTSSMSRSYQHPTDVIKAFAEVKDQLFSNSLLSRWSYTFVDFIVSNVAYNQTFLTGHHEAAEQLNKAAANLITEIDENALEQRLSLNDATLLGIYIAKHHSRLFEDYSVLTRSLLREKATLDTAIREKSR